MGASPERVRLLVMDVDGVLTDGSILIDDGGVETKRFSVRDGVGVRLWQKMGFAAAAITARSGQAVQHRMRELEVEHVIQGSGDKSRSLEELAKRTGIGVEEMAYLGDDWPDLCAMRRVGYPMAVADADPRVLAAAAYVTRLGGGRGAVREAVEHLLAGKGLMERALSLYD